MRDVVLYHKNEVLHRQSPRTRPGSSAMILESKHLKIAVDPVAVDPNLPKNHPYCNLPNPLTAVHFYGMFIIIEHRDS